TFPDTDFPLFRLGASYLTYAEATLRGAADDSREEALHYLNLLHQRAGGTDPLTAQDLNLDFLLAERGRELHWEAYRRSDLIRFNVFTTDGIWPWKGGVPAGMPSSTHLRLFPIPEAELMANPALRQNGGY
ncbi:MAG: RagB/SusD family nutrient uptake outer membrane protein, partial [Bacteroidota bacterium]